jgi:oligopeptide transport system substrate-binding protein
LTHNLFFPVRFDAVEQDPENWSKNPDIVISNGPFILKEYKADEYFILEKNPHYWNADTVSLTELTFSLRRSEDDIAELYNTDLLDGLFEVTASDLKKIYNGELDATSSILPSTAFMTFNHDNELMSDPRFREAISIALDRQGVVNEVLSGSGIPTRYLVPIIYKIDGESFRDFTDLDPGMELEKSRKLIQELKDDGIYDGRTITFHYMESGPDALVSEYLMEHLEENLGLDIELIGMSWTDLYSLSLNEDYDMLMMGWGADYPHPMTFLNIFVEGAFYAPITRWHDPDYEKAINDYLLITDEREALIALREIEDYVIGGHHIAPIYNRKGLALISQKVEGWYRSTFFDFTRAYIVE